MTYEEARNLIDEMRAEIKAKHMCRSMDGECTSEEVAEYRCRFAALSMAVEAIEKQTPKKVIYHDNCGNPTPYQPRCPRCYEAANDTWHWVGESYCEYCGQAMDCKGGAE